MNPGSFPNVISSKTLRGPLISIYFTKLTYASEPWAQRWPHLGNPSLAKPGDTLGLGLWGWGLGQVFWDLGGSRV